jgi:hypothetical protein
LPPVPSYQRRQARAAKQEAGGRMTTPDPFNDEGVPRGRYGRPLIHPAKRDGTPNLTAKLVEYDRASTVADALDTGGGLATWRVRHAAVGVALSPDLAAMAAALGRNVNTYSAEDKRNLDAIIESAHDRSGGNDKANYGTAIHSLTEPGNTGDIVNPGMAGDVASYLATIEQAGIEVDETETFVVNDELKVAGTFDHTYRFTRDVDVTFADGTVVRIPAGSKLIGDKKTGSLHFDAHAIQLAIYARGKRYDHNTGQREALDVSPQWGVIAHIAREQGETTLYLVDLHEGWVGAKLAVEVRAYTLGVKKRVSAPFATATAPIVPLDETAKAAHVTPATSDVNPADAVGAAVALVTDALNATPIIDVRFDPILDAIRNAASNDECATLWRQHKTDWTDVHTDAVKARAA